LNIRWRNHTQRVGPKAQLSALRRHLIRRVTLRELAYEHSQSSPHSAFPCSSGGLDQRVLELRHAAQLVQLDPLDLGKAARELVAGDAQLLGVLVSLADVIGELAQALVEAAEVLAQLRQLVLDDVHLPTGFDVLEYGARSIQHCHHRGRRDDPHAPLHGVVHHFGVVRMDLCEHRLRRDEHHRTVRGLAGDDVLLADVVDVQPQVGAELALGLGAVALVQSEVEHAVVVLQRELGVHRHHAGRLGQLQHAVGTVAVRQRVLELESVRRQEVSHQRLELDLAESAAGAFVTQQLLQAHDVAGEAVDLSLRLVDRRQPRHDVGKRFVGALEPLLQPLVHLAADLLQARVGGAGERLDRAGHLLADAVQGVVDELLVRAFLLGQALQHAGEQLDAQLVVLGVELGRQRAQALRLVLAVGGQLLGLRQLQDEQRIAGLLEILRDGVAQPLRVLGLIVPDTVRQAVEPVVEVLQHGEVLLLQHLRDHFRKILVPAQQCPHAEPDPQHRDQRDAGQRGGKDGEVAEVHFASIPRPYPLPMTAKAQRRKGHAKESYRLRIRRAGLR
jgi:hypothetical protein